MFRRGLKRAEKGGRGEGKDGEEGLLVAESQDCALHSLQGLEPVPGGSMQQNRGANAGADTAADGLANGDSVGVTHRSDLEKAGHEEARGAEPSERDGDKTDRAAGAMVRIDYKLQRSAAESMSDFITSIRSHRCLAARCRQRPLRVRVRVRVCMNSDVRTFQCRASMRAPKC